MADANFAERLRIFDELGDEILRRRRGECAVEMKNQEMRDTEVPDQRDFMLRCRQQMRRIVRPQNLDRVWIEGDDDSRPAGFVRMPRRSRDDGLMAEVDAVENADREKKRTAQLSKLGNRTQNFHQPTTR